MYDINLKNVKKGRSFFYSFIIAGVIMFVIFILCLNPSNEYFDNVVFTSPIIILLSFLFIYVPTKNILKINKRIELIKELNQKGKLIKGLKYQLEDTGMAVNDVHIKRPIIYYTLPNGVTLTLYGDPRHDGKEMDSDGLVDLVIDENNPENYFIDFEINRLSGNLPQDYYDNSQQPVYSSEDFENMSPSQKSQTIN